MLGAVAIGRNEGERLSRSLASLTNRGFPVVYVDSGSTDRSAELARSLGVDVVELDPSSPFTAARARNAGFARLAELMDAKYVQFVDGDSVILPGWIQHGRDILESNAEIAAVCGRLREFQPEASVFKRLLDLEWDRPPGEALASGGNVMVRARAFREAGGFDARLSAGEEPDFCLRLRRLGWRIRRLGVDMAEHDAGAFGLRDWWRRALRGGAASAANLALHWRKPEPHQLKAVLSSLFWGGFLPFSVVAAAPAIESCSLLLVLAYPIQIWRVSRRLRRAGRRQDDARLEALATIAAKPAQVAGIIRYTFGRI